MPQERPIVGVLVALLLVGFVANVYHVRQQYHVDGKLTRDNPHLVPGFTPLAHAPAKVVFGLVLLPRLSPFLATRIVAQQRSHVCLRVSCLHASDPLAPTYLQSCACRAHAPKGRVRIASLPRW